MKFSKNVFAVFSTLLLATALSSNANSAVIGTYNFDYKCATCLTKEVTFQLPSSPTVVSPASDHFTLQNITTSMGVEDLSFFLLASFGGFRIENATTNVTLIDIFGPQLFTGALANPTFTLGTFQTTTNTSGGASSQVVISAVPEPTTVALLGLGLLGVAASRRKAAKK